MEVFRKSPRKKIWEIQNIYHCSVLGTCLSLIETRKIFRKEGITFPRDYRDYEIHGAVVNVVNSKNEVSKSINIFLDKKYSDLIAIFNKGNSEEELILLWEEFLEEGNIAGAYWAVITHPSVSQDSLDRAFGDVHMLSHLNGSSNREHIKENAELKKQNSILAETNKKYSKKISNLEFKLKDHEENIEKIKYITTALDRAENEILLLKNGHELSKINEENIRLVRKYSEAAEEKARFSAEIKLSNERINELTAKNELLTREIKIKENELKIIEGSITAILQKGKAFCNGCANDEENRINLCGKCILYVGGRPSVVSRCREMVELFGGKFIHHDGGIEENISRLPAVFNRADVIFCPLDCISHEASLYVKKMSYQQQKPFIFMKSSGFSTFLKEMTDITKTQLNANNENIMQS